MTNYLVSIVEADSGYPMGEYTVMAENEQEAADKAVDLFTIDECNGFTNIRALRTFVVSSKGC